MIPPPKVGRPSVGRHKEVQGSSDHTVLGRECTVAPVQLERLPLPDTQSKGTEPDQRRPSAMRPRRFWTEASDLALGPRKRVRRTYRGVSPPGPELVMGRRHLRIVGLVELDPLFGSAVLAQDVAGGLKQGRAERGQALPLWARARTAEQQIAGTGGSFGAIALVCAGSFEIRNIRTSIRSVEATRVRIRSK